MGTIVFLSPRRFLSCRIQSGIGTVVALVVLLIVASEAIFLTTGKLVAEEQPNPFADYEAIMPGQSTQALTPYACQYPSTVYAVISTITQCHITLIGEPFSAVTVIFGNGQIQQLLFTVNDALNTGDLAGQWGRPDVIEKSDIAFLLTWDEGISAIATLDTTFDYNLPVQSVWFSGEESE